MALAHALVEAADGVLLEVRRSAMGFEGGIVDILLVDKDSAGVVGDEMGDVTDAAGLPARTFSEGDQIGSYGFVVGLFKAHADGEGEHIVVSSQFSVVRKDVRT